MSSTQNAELIETPPTRTAVPFALVGPTASGKTEASVELAKRLDAEVLLLDSMTVYRGMDVGTAKPSAEQRRQVPHHLVDIANPAEPFSVAAFQRLANAALTDIRTRGRAALLVGGSGLYYRAVVDQLVFPRTEPAIRLDLETEARAVGSSRLYRRLEDVDPIAAGKVEPSNTRRVVRALEVAGMTGRPFSSFAEAWDRYPEERVRAAGVKVPAEVLKSRIEERAHRLFEGGLLEETSVLLDKRAHRTAFQAIGYAEAAEHLVGAITLGEAREKMVRRTKALARRQMAWFKRDPRIRWFDADSAADAVDQIEEFFRS